MKQEQPKPGQAREITRFLEKIVIDAGVGRASQNPNFEEKGLPQISRDIALLGGQKPQIRRARKSIAGFKIREGQVVGLRATLRSKKMVDFFERLIKIVWPRMKDFRGLELRAVDAGGALNAGVKEHFVFPEIKPEESPLSFSLGISIVPRKKNRDEAIKKLRELGAPLKKN